MTKKYLFYLCFLVILFLLETSSLRVFSDYQFLVPQFLLLFIIIFSFNHSWTEILWFSFLAGFLQELFSYQFFGAEIFSFVLIGFLGYFVTTNFVAREVSFPLSIFLVLISSWLFLFLTFVFHDFGAIFRLVEPLGISYLFSVRVLWLMAVNLLVFYPLRSLFRLLPQ